MLRRPARILVQVVWSRRHCNSWLALTGRLSDLSRQSSCAGIVAIAALELLRRRRRRHLVSGSHALLAQQIRAVAVLNARGWALRNRGCWGAAILLWCLLGRLCPPGSGLITTSLLWRKLRRHPIRSRSRLLTLYVTRRRSLVAVLRRRGRTSLLCW